VTDADTISTLDTVAHRVRTWRAGNYRYTETSNFSVTRGGEIHFEDITSSALCEEDKAMLEGVLPYPTDAYVPFSMPYLLGYSAKKRDLEREDLSAEVRDRMHGYATTLLRNTVRGYSMVSTEMENFRFNNKGVKYALLPVWMLSTKYKGENFLFAMNGQTGKLIGDLPVDKGKFWGLFAAIAAPLAIISSLIWILL
jgi:hypothetical protein